MVDCKKVDTLLEHRFGAEDTLKVMRENQCTVADPEGLYIWQLADGYIQTWFQDFQYHLNSTEIFDDCIGYGCTRKGVEYAIYVYAYGKEKTSSLDGDYCAKLRDHNLSVNRTILVIYLHVTAEEQPNGETIFSVGCYNSKDNNPDVWNLGWIGQQSAIPKWSFEHSYNPSFDFFDSIFRRGIPQWSIHFCGRVVP